MSNKESIELDIKIIDDEEWDKLLNNQNDDSDDDE